VATLANPKALINVTLSPYVVLPSNPMPKTETNLNPASFSDRISEYVIKATLVEKFSA
jgi:hypothetical protein